MLSRLLRKWSPALLAPVVGIFMRLGISANELTMAGFVLALAAGALIAYGFFTAAACALLASGLVDAFDGELARRENSATAYGAFLDSTADHYGDFAVYLGLAWKALEGGAETSVLLVLVALFGSVMGSQIRS